MTKNAMAQALYALLQADGFTPFAVAEWLKSHSVNRTEWEVAVHRVCELTPGVGPLPDCTAEWGRLVDRAREVAQVRHGMGPWRHALPRWEAE